MGAILQTTLSNIFPCTKIIVFSYLFLKCPNDKNKKNDSDDGLAFNRRQAIIWTNDDQVHWRICASRESVDEKRILHTSK